MINAATVSLVRTSIPVAGLIRPPSLNPLCSARGESDAPKRNTQPAGMGQGASGLPGAPGGPPGGPGGDKKDEKKKKKFEPRPPMRTGKRKRKKGPSVAVRTPQGACPTHRLFFAQMASTAATACTCRGMARESGGGGAGGYSSIRLSCRCQPLCGWLVPFAIKLACGEVFRTTVFPTQYRPSPKPAVVSKSSISTLLHLSSLELPSRWP